MDKDFTLNKYKQLCQAIRQSGYQTTTITDYMQNGAKDSCIILRHDVDRKPYNALKMARLEHQMGIHSTYYFRHIPTVFLPDIIQEIFSLSHEIGYHYETLSKSRGNFSKAIRIFEKELEEFRQYTPVTTISMHGRPFSKWDNRDLWKKYDLKQFEIGGECYLSIDYDTVTYLSDTGRTWHPGKYNIRDHVAGKSPDHIESTDDLIRYISSHEKKILCLLTHPNRWADSSLEWVLENNVDFCINQLKKFLLHWKRPH